MVSAFHCRLDWVFPKCENSRENVGNVMTNSSASCLDQGIDQFTIEWNNGEKEIGRYHLGKYKILSHSSDELAIGTTQKWEHQSVPFDLKLKMKVWMSIHDVKPLPKTKSRKRKSFQILRLQDPSVKKNL